MTPLLRPVAFVLLVAGACWYFDAGYPQIALAMFGGAGSLVL